LRSADDNEDSKFVGQIAEVRLWSVARSASQISQTWKVPIRQASNLVVSWRMAQVRRISLPPSLARHPLPFQFLIVHCMQSGNWVDDESGNGHAAGFGESPQFRTYGCSSAGRFPQHPPALNVQHAAGTHHVRAYMRGCLDCSAYSSCVPTQSDPGGRLLPDITLDADRLQRSMEIITRTFDSTSWYGRAPCAHHHHHHHHHHSSFFILHQ
jgi:hypothetical protein